MFDWDDLPEPDFDDCPEPADPPGNTALLVGRQPMTASGGNFIGRRLNRSKQRRP